jgi:hypothetical protein
VDGVVLALLEEAEAAGLRVSVDGNTLRIRGPKTGAPIAQQLTARKPEVLALLSDGRERAIRVRVDAFRPQVPETGPIPFLVMTPSIVPGACLSCGESLDRTERYRCGLCAEAARRVIAEAQKTRNQKGSAS